MGGSKRPEDNATPKTESKIEARLKAIQAKKQKPAIVEQSIDTDENSNNRIRRSGKDGMSIGRDAESTLRKYAELAGIKQFELFPGKEYPTPFTRLPLFVPAQRRKARAAQQAATRDTDFVKLESRWDKGGVYRSGPPLTVYDEDTFIGLLHMRSMGFKGPSSNMPSKRIGKAPNAPPSTNVDQVNVHSGYCVVSQLETIIRGESPPKKGWPGRDIALRRESIERLGATVLKFVSPQNLDHYRGKQIQIVAIDWIGDRRDACYYFEFHPAIVRWLEEFRTYIDLKVRRQLTPFGKALHRFLSSQRSSKSYEVQWAVVLEAVGYQGRIADAKRFGLEELGKMQDLGFLSAATIEGTGRRTPYVLKVQF